MACEAVQSRHTSEDHCEGAAGVNRSTYLVKRLNPQRDTLHVSRFTNNEA